jgi:hypothetical protein
MVSETFSIVKVRTICLLNKGFYDIRTNTRRFIIVKCLKINEQSLVFIIHSL